MRRTDIRPARKTDASNIGKIGYAAWVKGIGNHVEFADRNRISPQTFVTFAQSHTDQIIVAEKTNAITGFTATENGDNYISDLMVAPENEGCGVGTALLSAMERLIGGRGYDTVELEVLTANTRALRLYQHLSYRIVWRGNRRDKALSTALHKTRLEKRIATVD